MGGSKQACACVKTNMLAPQPTTLSFEQAAAVPISGSTALQAVRKAQVQPRQKVLIVGASGGVGTFAVQIAKAFGAESSTWEESPAGATASNAGDRTYPLSETPAAIGYVRAGQARGKEVITM
jgi:NADPH:quinone reductase-like Zn-dependent oxidoreductase